jgi:vacuolar protein sorting-associated protein 13A/C
VGHYKTQVIKQAYILLLGLDVLGNPFGVIRGLAEGVESLFYEPYAGIVQGPGEFVEGLTLGIGKLFGNTLGGAAGAFSKITGTLGKGLATLSMDKDFQKTRQKNADLKPTFLQNVGQNLVMGVVSGVTGIVEKPIEGAKSGGALGLFGGIGKGLLGVVTKPTAGIVDFTSQSLEGIRKYGYLLLRMVFKRIFYNCTKYI